MKLNAMILLTLIADKKRTAQMQQSLDGFAQLDIPSMVPTDIKSSLVSLFPSGAVPV